MNSDIVILLHNIKCLYFLYFLPIGSHAFNQLLPTYMGVFEELTSPWRLPRRRKMSRRLLRHPEDGWGSRHKHSRGTSSTNKLWSRFYPLFFFCQFLFFTVGEFKNLIMSSLQLGFIKSVKSFLFWSLERFHLGFHISVHLHSLFVYHFYPHTSILFFLGARADTWPTLLTEKMFIEHSRVPLLWR